VTFRFQDGACLFTLKDDQGEYPIRCGLEKWVTGETTMPGTPPNLVTARDPKKTNLSKVAASGTWKDANTFEMTWRFYETPHHDTVTCRFDGSRVNVTFLNSMAAMNPQGKDKRPVLQGRV